MPKNLFVFSVDDISNSEKKNIAWQYHCQQSALCWDPPWTRSGRSTTAARCTALSREDLSAGKDPSNLEDSPGGIMNKNSPQEEK